MCTSLSFNQTHKNAVLVLQMNCAHLENCLHEAREEAQTHLCAVNRRTSDYNVLRLTVVKMCGRFARLRNCISSIEVAALADSLHALSQSLSRLVFFLRWTPDTC